MALRRASVITFHSTGRPGARRALGWRQFRPPDTSVVRLHAMTRRVLWLAPLVTVTALLAVWVAAPSVYRFFAIDSCLDSGGAWDYGRNGCLHSNR